MIPASGRENGGGGTFRGYGKTHTSCPVSDHRSPPPAAEACLERPRPSSQKGGTLIAEEVTDLETHGRRICDPDSYRPAECPTCSHGSLHMHDRRSRLLLADPVAAPIWVAIYRCAGCGGTWRILPCLVARRLWRSWRVVEAWTIAGPSQPRVPERTQRRWRQRLRSSASSLLQILASSGSAALQAIVTGVGIVVSRVELVTAYAAMSRSPPGLCLARLAALIHRIMPGVRLM